MKGSILDIVMHPVRMRIIQTMIMGGSMTTQQIGESMPEVPQATLYRSLNALLVAGVIEVAEERPVRGTLEKVYCLPESLAGQMNEDMLRAGRDEQFKYFFRFLMNLLGAFERYTGQENINMKEDGLGFRQASVYATDEEFALFGRELGEELKKLLQNKPAEGRRLRTVATIVIPQAQSKK